MRWRNRSLPLQGVTVSLADAVLPPAVAEIVAKVVAVTACAVTGNATELLDVFPMPFRREGIRRLKKPDEIFGRLSLSRLRLPARRHLRFLSVARMSAVRRPVVGTAAFLWIALVCVWTVL